MGKVADNVPPFNVKLPDVSTKLVVGFNVPLVKFNEPPLIVNVVHVKVPIIVGLPSTNVVTAVVEFPLAVIVPDPRRLKVKKLYVPLDENVMLLTFITDDVDVLTPEEVVPKSS